MRINEVDKPVTQADIDMLEVFADRLFAKVGIDVEFTRHFLDRVNDERNVRQITMSELTRLFKQEFKRWGKQVAQLGPDAEAVFKDLQTDVNMPFALRYDKNNNELDLIAKTVMRKKDFKTSNQEFAVEGKWDWVPGTGALKKWLKDKLDGKPGDKTPDKPGNKTPDKPGDKTPDKPGDKTIDKPNDKPNDKPVDKPDGGTGNGDAAIGSGSGAAGNKVIDKTKNKKKKDKDSKSNKNVKVTGRGDRRSNPWDFLIKYGPHAQRGDDISDIVLDWDASAETKKALMEGGSMPGVGAIHIEEINPTLEQLEKGLDINLKDFVLGSVGKREFSGDIDVALNLKPEEIPEFIAKLKNSPLVYDIAKTSVIITKVKIVNYDESKKDGRPRTGFVQLDFMPGDPGWLKTYYHSPSDKESKYKGVFRNIMIASMSAVHNRQDSTQTIEDGRPLESIRYMWSPADGLIKVKRTPAPRKDGNGYTKKNIDTKIDGPWKNADEIAKELGIDSGQQLNSFESLLDAIKKNYTKEALQKVVKGFSQNRAVQDIGVPEELNDAI